MPTPTSACSPATSPMPAATTPMPRWPHALRRLPMPAHLLPGNHDSRAALRRHFPQLPADDGGFMQTVLATPAGRFLLLDTVEAGAPWGSYCAERQAWLAQQLAASGDMPLYDRHAPPAAGARHPVDGPVRPARCRSLVVGHRAAPHAHPPSLFRPSAPADRRQLARHSVLVHQFAEPPGRARPR